MLAFVNECTGPAVPPALYIAFAERQLDISLPTTCVSLEVTMTCLPMQEFAAFIGIDWADATHSICLQAAGSDTRESSVLAHTPEAIDAWARALRSRFGGRPLAVCLELTKGPLVSALRNYAFFVLFPVNALTVAKYRQAFTPSRAKDDPSDAELQDEGVITPQVCLVRALVAQLRATLQAIEDFDRAIAQLAPTHPDFTLFQALPGAGPVFAPRLLVAFGEQRERFPSAAELQKYAGIAPVTERSGNTCRVHWWLQCPKFLRQTFVEWANESIRHSFWARAYYAQQRATGSTHQAATRALAFKWIRILYRCWQTKTPYNESTYLSALVRRGSPLIRNLANVS
jgi:hypothetical protein